MNTTNTTTTNTAALVAAHLQAIKAQRYTVAPQEIALAIVAAGVMIHTLC